MFSRKTGLEAPSEFDFPFVPYDIQRQLMKSLYEVIERRQIGIFESPTGTGKSLTLTCGALKWLCDHDNLVKAELNCRIEEIQKEIEDSELKEAKSKDWISVQFGTMRKKDEAVELKKTRTLIQEYENRIAELKERRMKEKMKITPRYQRTATGTGSVESNLEEEDLVIADYSEEERDGEEEGQQNPFKDVKILFASRTHSQLAQVVREVKRTKYGQDIRCVSLASRQNLCINPTVNRLASSSVINEQCLDMQKSQSKETASDRDGRSLKKTRTKQSACPYKTQLAIEGLRDSTLVDIVDIEDLVTAGETLKACPYYSSRMASKDAQLIMLPYQMLLHRKTRLQTGIDLENNIVIIDEAHNLLDTISSIYSTEISLEQLQKAYDQLVAYKMKYCSRFSTKNLLKINQLIFVTKCLTKMMIGPTAARESSSRMMMTHELMSEGEFFNMDLFKILEFCDQTRLAQKVHGCAQRSVTRKPVAVEKENDRTGASRLLQKLEQDEMNKKKKPKLVVEDVQEDAKDAVKISQNSTSSVIRPLLAFLESLTESCDDGRVLLKFDSDPKKAGMKFMLLNPGGHFEEFVQQCRAVIIAGGTMQPTAELTEQLFKSCPDRVRQHFYGHVVPPESVLPFVVQKGPTGKKFLFNFSNRNSTEMLSELGMNLVNICQIIPAGIVCFFASYDYLDQVYQHLTKSGHLAKIEMKKHVFREPRAGGQSIEKVLSEYAKGIGDSQRQGSILFSVVGGKLSEGLNFADDLGRCVIVVGMPYPNKSSPELQEKIKYLENNFGIGTGTEYYENLCMKAVNQCIGRSVRHINDYATVLLLDERYNSDRIQNKLPQWISRSLKSPDKFGLIQGSIAKFFRERRKT